MKMKVELDVKKTKLGWFSIVLSVVGAIFGAAGTIVSTIDNKKIAEKTYREEAIKFLTEGK